MKELLKSILLIALTFSAIIMTKTIFIGSTVNAEAPAIVFEKIELIEYIRPQNYIFSFGDSFIKLYDDEFENMNIKKAYEATFEAFLTSPADFSISEVSEEVWLEHSQRKSMTVQYPFSINLTDLLEIHHFNTKLVGEIDDLRISEVLLLLNKKDSMLIYDAQKNLYFRLSSGDESTVWINDLFEHIDLYKTNDYKYLSIEERWDLLKTGLKKYDLTEGNLLLTPTSNNISYPKYKVIKEIDFGEHASEQLERYAKKIFGDDLSFVKKSVYADKSTIFMYGYGEKVFEINEDGSLIYTVKPESDRGQEPIEFIEGLEESVYHIGLMGLPTPDLYLADYYQIETNNSVESIYSFNAKRNGMPLYNKNTSSGDLIEVRFLNADLVRIKKDSRVISNLPTDDFQSSFNFPSIMEKNRFTFELRYLKDREGTIIEASDFFQMALQEMTQLERSYYILGDELIPIWHIIIAERHYMIDLTTGLIIDDFK